MSVPIASLVKDAVFYRMKMKSTKDEASGNYTINYTVDKICIADASVDQTLSETEINSGIKFVSVNVFINDSAAVTNVSFIGGITQDTSGDTVKTDVVIADLYTVIDDANAVCEKNKSIYSTMDQEVVNRLGALLV